MHYVLRSLGRVMSARPFLACIASRASEQAALHSIGQNGEFFEAQRAQTRIWESMPGVSRWQFT